MQNNIVIIDYGMGNLRSVLKKFEHIGIPAIISSDPDLIYKADKLVLPGVGHFTSGMANLSSRKLLSVMNEKVILKQTPILGICLGLQLFARHSEEGNCDGLGWIDAEVTRFRVSDSLTYKVPHIGWNSLKIEKDSRLMKGIQDSSSFYFVHSYHMSSCRKEDILSVTEYEYSFTSSIEKDNIFGTQFHPEKSHDIGELLLKNFANL